MRCTEAESVAADDRQGATTRFTQGLRLHIAPNLGEGRPPSAQLSSSLSRLHRRWKITTFENVAAPNVEQHSQCEQHQTVRQGSRTNRISFLVVFENPKR
jgi:hypothetical protein